MRNTKQPVIGPAARMRCRRCGRVFTVRPGRFIAHDRRHGALYVHCDGGLAADVPQNVAAVTELTPAVKGRPSSSGSTTTT